MDASSSLDSDPDSPSAGPSTPAEELRPVAGRCRPRAPRSAKACCLLASADACKRDATPG
eukprot:8860752-Pyramimonas_sp.AAC.1